MNRNDVFPFLCLIGFCVAFTYFVMVLAVIQR